MTVKRQPEWRTVKSRQPVLITVKRRQPEHYFAYCDSILLMDPRATLAFHTGSLAVSLSTPARAHFLHSTPARAHFLLSTLARSPH
jgi:hypothetical protein